jgi:excisionase family DNA binding protein
MTSQTEEFALTVPEGARLIRSGPRALYKLIAEGKCPHLKVGRKIIIPRAAFLRWLENGGRN